MEENRNHTFLVENNKKITVTAVAEVDSVTSENISLTLTNSKRIIITGQNLRTCAFSKQSGAFSAEGIVLAVKYAGEKSSFVKKLLK